MSELAIRLPIAALITEYDSKVESAKEAISRFEQSIADLGSSSTIQGTYGVSLGNYISSPSQHTVLRSLVVSAWRHLYVGLHINKIAPASDRARFEREIEDPPEFTADNIRASFGQYITDPRQHILRGLAEAFCSLDKAYKSHSNVKIGVQRLPKRIILSGCGDRWSWGANRAIDSINALRLVQERGAVSWAGVGNDKTLDGLTFRKFKNGNLHIIFDKQTQRDINLALAEYYGEVLADAPDENLKKSTGTAVSKDFQYYPSPERVADELAQYAYGEGIKVLEPQSGCGRILDAVKGQNQSAKIYGYEVHGGRAQQCRDKGYTVLTRNFLEVPPTPDFDRVLMNPPFYGRHYLKHINHAIRFLKPGSLVASVLPATAWYDHGELPDGGSWNDLPVGSFSESGTNVPTGIWTYWKPDHDLHLEAAE